MPINMHYFTALMNKANAMSSEVVSPFVVKGKRAFEAAKALNIHNMPVNLRFDILGGEGELDLHHIAGEDTDYLEDLTLDRNDSDPKNGKVIINWLVRFVGTMMDKINKHALMIKFNQTTKADQEEVAELRQKLNQLEQHCDVIQQRSMKGNLIISSPNLQHKASLLEPAAIQRNGSQAREDATELCTRLIKMKTGVTVPLLDISACHVLKRQGSNASYIIRFHNMRPGSAWESITAGMMTGKNLDGQAFSDANVYLSFQVTHAKGELLKEARALRSSKGIWKYSTDQNGKIAIQAKKFGPWTHISSLSELKVVAANQRAAEQQLQQNRAQQQR